MYTMMKVLIVRGNIGDLPLTGEWPLQNWEYRASIYKIIFMIENKSPKFWNGGEIRGHDDWEEVVK